MSRCFPFPPPGYESKARRDDVDILRKEKHREKKHKKEKRDKDKREGKEKRDKDRGDRKHREKDKKDKHCDKKNREKVQEKDKDKHTISSEKRVAEQVEGCKGENLGRKGDNIKHSSRKDVKRSADHLEGHNGVKLTQSIQLADLARDANVVQVASSNSNHDDLKKPVNQFAENFRGTDWENEGAPRWVGKDVGTCSQAMQKRGVKNRQLDRPSLDNVVRSSEKYAVVQNLPNGIQNRLEEMPRPVENMEYRVNVKDAEEKEGDGKRGKHKMREKAREKRSQGKDKDRNKEREDEKVKQTAGSRNTENGKSRDSNRNSPSFTQKVHPLNLLKDSNSVAAEGKIRKRTEVEANGVLHDNDVRANKLPRTAAFQALKENGTISAHCPPSTPSPSEGPNSGLKSDSKLKRVNGFIEAPLSTVAITKPILAITQADQVAEGSVQLSHSASDYVKPSSAIKQADQVGQASAKPTHPDSKYLDQVLSVPKMEEWCDIDDQEWLFNSSSHPEKPRISLDDEIQQVRAEALPIELADVCALPYVIPY